MANQCTRTNRKRAAKELDRGEVINLGIGIPTLVAKYVDITSNIYLPHRKWDAWCR